ncbi:hypothetical protein D3C75_1154230 [compost metagenome]
MSGRFKGNVDDLISHRNGFEIIVCIFVHIHRIGFTGFRLCIYLEVHLAVIFAELHKLSIYHKGFRTHVSIEA